MKKVDDPHQKQPADVGKYAIESRPRTKSLSSTELQSLSRSPGPGGGVWPGREGCDKVEIAVMAMGR